MSLTEYMSSPSTVPLLSQEVRPFTLDCSTFLQSGETVTGITTSLTNLQPGPPVTLTDAPTIGSPATTVSQTLRGAEVAVGNQYRLSWVVTCSTGRVIQELTYITVPA